MPVESLDPGDEMSKTRMEAFSDGVMAIIITIMVLELRPPQGVDLSSLKPLVPRLASYTVSFVFLGIYWSNHHHLLQAVEKVNGAILWANLHLLFWLSLTSLVTAWMGGNGFAGLPVALYGVVLFFSAVAYFILVRALLARHGRNSMLARAIGNDFKGKISVVFYLAAIPAAFWQPWIAYGVYVLVAVMWLVPDRRIEKALSPR